MINFSRNSETVPLLMEIGVGVTHRLVKIPKIDTDYFEELHPTGIELQS